MTEKGKVVLLGGTGLLGSSLEKELESRGKETVTVARGVSRNTPPDHSIDLRQEPEKLSRIISPGDTVVYLLGLSPLKRPVGGRRAYRELHVTTLRRVLVAAPRAGARRLIYLSALGVHRSAGAAYAETKAAAEALLEQSSLPTTIVAPSILFGPGSEIISALGWISKSPALPMPIIDACFRPIHVADAARRLCDELLLDAPASRLELVGPEELTFTELARSYLEPRGVKLWLLPRGVSQTLIGIASPLKIPGLPSEIGAMLAIDNSGRPPEAPEGMVRFGEWAAK